MTWTSVKNKIFPIIVLLLAVTLNSFSGMKRSVLTNELSISARHSNPDQGKAADAETPQNTEKQENDDKVEVDDDLFIVECFNERHINHEVNHIYEFQIAIYHEHHRVIFSPPPEA